MSESVPVDSSLQQPPAGPTAANHAVAAPSSEKPEAAVRQTSGPVGAPGICTEAPGSGISNSVAPATLPNLLTMPVATPSNLPLSTPVPGNNNTAATTPFSLTPPAPLLSAISLKPVAELSKTLNAVPTAGLTQLTPPKLNVNVGVSATPPKLIVTPPAAITPPAPLSSLTTNGQPQLAGQGTVLIYINNSKKTCTLRRFY